MKEKTRACTGHTLNRALALVTMLAALGACKGEPYKPKPIFKELRPVEVFTATEVDISVTLEFDSDPSVLPALFD